MPLAHAAGRPKAEIAHGDHASIKAMHSPDTSGTSATLSMCSAGAMSSGMSGSHGPNAKTMNSAQIVTTLWLVDSCGCMCSGRE